MKTFVILFFDDYLPYSPTVINLMHGLREQNKVTVIAPAPKCFGKYDHPDVQYIDMQASWVWPHSIGRVGRKIGLPMRKDRYLDLLTFVKVNSLRNALRRASYDVCIVIDPMALWIAQSLGIKAHFVSLELLQSPLSKYVSYRDIRSFCIQNPERLQAGDFGEISCPIFYVPNSTIFKQRPSTKRDIKQLVFCGTAVRGFGIYTCLHFLKANPEYHMTLLGTLPHDVWSDIVKFWPELVDNQRLLIHKDYIDESAMSEFLSRFSIGFCIYDTRFPEINNVNFLTAPSGKLWKYLAAGIPVIASDLPGLKLVRDRGCGVLISNLTTEALAAAIRTIEANYDAFQVRALATAEEFSFEVQAAPYVAYLNH